MAAYLMGIDYGTGGAKACIIDTQGAVLAYAFEEYPILHPKPGWSEHDPHLYWEIACRIIKACINQAHVQAAEIKGVACSSALPSLVMVDKAGNPVHNAYNLMDRRATAEVEWLKAHVGAERIFKLSAYRLEDHPNIVNLMWERNNRPESFKTIHKSLTIDGFITSRLTGAFTAHYSAACFWGVAYDILNKRFDDAMLEQVGIDKALMPELRKCEEVVGEVTAEAAAQTGLAAGTPVAAGQVDCNAGWLGGGATEVGDIQSNLGTCGNFGVIHKSTDFIYELMEFGYTVESEDTYICVPTTITGGQSIRYLRDTFSQAELEAERALGVDAYDLLNLQAEKAPLGCEGLIVLPFLMGERSPIWDVHARGCIFGLSLNHTKGHLVRATMEGVAFAMYDSFRIIRESGRKINLPLVMNEGGAKSRLWRQIITDVFNVPTVLVKRRTGAPFGDAILAGVATGVLKSFSVAKEWAEYVEQMDPRPENHERYLEYFGLYKKIYEHVKQDYRELADLRSAGAQG
ncbi:MAG: FGGY-family carbohydrate kinase [Kiritimatiellae bacterium]|nr:FGGY-family carbohydrate kinase [Kiritimatiellia bacterium]